MSPSILAIDMQPKVRAKAVALPVEHGSWGFLFEPLIAGIAVAPSPASPWIALMLVGAFLMRRPLKVILTDWQNGRWLPQTKVAVRFLLLYAAIFCSGLTGSLLLTTPDSFIPLVLVIPFAAYQIYCDATGNSRQLVAEIIGSVAISSSIAVLAIADNWTFPKAFGLWAIVAARLIPSILYVRNRLFLEKGKAYSRAIPISAHLLAAIFVLGAAIYGFAPFLTVLVFGVLLLRSAVGLSSYRKKVKAMKIGIGEVIYGTLTVVSLIVGYYAGL